MSSSQRNLLIACGVVLLHAAALWALQTGLAHRAPELFIPVEISSELIAPPQPTPPAPAAMPQPPQVPQPRPAVQPRLQKVPEKKTRAEPPAPTREPPPPHNAAAPEPVAPTVSATPEPPAPPQSAPPAQPAAPAAAAPTAVELPSSNADYLQNPPPTYPAISKRLGEQGSVVVRVLIGADGRPKKAELKNSSGFDRLDRAALTYVMNCRYTPGKVNGVPQDMWYDAPVRYVLE